MLLCHRRKCVQNVVKKLKCKSFPLKYDAGGLQLRSALKSITGNFFRYGHIDGRQSCDRSILCLENTYVTSSPCVCLVYCRSFSGRKEASPNIYFSYYYVMK